MLLLASVASAAVFSPTLLKLSAPPTVNYKFDASALSIPVTASGAPASAVFCVYTKDKSSSIVKVKNGFLGWHYVNKIDTSIFISGVQSLKVGSNTLTWNGKDENGNAVAPGTYTYYIWAYDSINTRIRMCKVMTPGGGNSARDMIVSLDDKGVPLAQPWAVTGGRSTGMNNDVATAKIHRKWIIGRDPEDVNLLETTSAMAWADNAYIAFLPTDHTMWFKATQTPAGDYQLTKYKWVPNGASQAQLTWGDQGNSKFTLPGKSAEWHSSVAVLDKGGDLFAPNNNFFNTTEGKSEIVYIDIDDGSITKRLDIAEWWVRPDNYTLGGQLNGGPTCIINAGNGLLHLSYHGTCIQQVIDPYRDGDINDMTVWANGNGDYIMDRNSEADSKKPWVCNDYNAPGISTYNTTDANGFSVMPVHALGAASFGVLAPDGTGIGYLAFAGDVTGPKWTDVFVDTGCAYDGLYSDNPAAATADDRTGWYWIAHDSIKGVISNIVDVAEEAPSAFTVSQNTPNPFNPGTTISFALSRAGQTTVAVYNAAGQKVETILNANLNAGSHSVTWNAAKHSAGVYFYTVTSNGQARTMKMTLLK